MNKSNDYKEGFKAGFEEARKCAAGIAEMNADYYNSKHKDDVLRKAASVHIMDLINGLRHDLTRGEQELIKGMKIKFPNEEARKEYREAYGYED